MKLSINLLDDSGFSEHDLKMHLAVKLYQDGIASSGYVANMIGMDRRDFLEQMGPYGGEIFQYSEDEIEEDKIVAGEISR